MAKCFVDDTSLTSIAEAIRTKGGTTDQLVFPDGFISAIEAIEAGGVSGITYGTYIPTETGKRHIIEHGLGVIPKLFAICAGAYVNRGSDVLDSAHGFSDRNLLFRMSRVKAVNSPTGYIYENDNITKTFFANNTAIAQATAETIHVGGYYNLTAGTEYFWFAIA